MIRKTSIFPAFEPGIFSPEDAPDNGLVFPWSNERDSGPEPRACVRAASPVPVGGGIEKSFAPARGRSHRGDTPRAERRLRAEHISRAGRHWEFVIRNPGRKLGVLSIIRKLFVSTRGKCRCTGRNAVRLFFARSVLDASARKCG